MKWRRDARDKRHFIIMSAVAVLVADLLVLPDLWILLTYYWQLVFLTKLHMVPFV